jgi:hypothetical protein
MLAWVTSTFLVRKRRDSSPPTLSGGYLANADASKQFHNFPTKPDERRYQGCIHPITGPNWCGRGSPMGTSNYLPSCAESTMVLFTPRVESTPQASMEWSGTTGDRNTGGEPYDPSGSRPCFDGSDGSPQPLKDGRFNYLIHSPNRSAVNLWRVYDHMLR